MELKFASHKWSWSSSSRLGLEISLLSATQFKNTKHYAWLFNKDLAVGLAKSRRGWRSDQEMKTDALCLQYPINSTEDEAAAINWIDRDWKTLEAYEGSTAILYWSSMNITRHDQWSRRRWTVRRREGVIRQLLQWVKQNDSIQQGIWFRIHIVQ